MKKFALPVAIAMTLSLAACNNSQAPAESAPAAPAPAATAPVESAPAASASVQVSAEQLGGTFKGSVPCASCPGIDVELVLNADGNYTLKETYQGEQGGPVETTGSWTLADGKVTLVDGKGVKEPRLFAVDSKDVLTMLNAYGERSENAEMNYSLKRS